MKHKAWKIPSLSVLSSSPLKTSSLVNQNPMVGDSHHWAESCPIWHPPSLSCWASEHLCPSLHALPRFPLPSALSLRVFPTPGTPGESGPFSPPSPLVSFCNLILLYSFLILQDGENKSEIHLPLCILNYCWSWRVEASFTLWSSIYWVPSVPGTALGVGNSMVIMVLALMMLTVKGMKTGNKQVNK